MVVLGFSWLYIKCSSRMVLVLHSLHNSVGIKVKVLPSYMSTVASPIFMVIILEFQHIGWIIPYHSLSIFTPRRRVATIYCWAAVIQQFAYCFTVGTWDCITLHLTQALKLILKCPNILLLPIFQPGSPPQLPPKVPERLPLCLRNQRSPSGRGTSSHAITQGPIPARVRSLTRTVPLTQLSWKKKFLGPLGPYSLLKMPLIPDNSEFSLDSTSTLRRRGIQSS